MTKYLVTGATGQLGRGIVENLLNRVPAHQIAVLVRNPSAVAEFASLGVSVRQGDYEDRSSLDAAFNGINKLLFVSTTAFSDAITQHHNVINAAATAGVHHIHYTGIQRPANSSFKISQVSEWELATERALAESGMAVTLLRNVLYLDALAFMLGDRLLIDGVRLPAGKAGAALAARSDLAEAAAVVLTQAGHEGRTYSLGGSEAVSMANIAQIVSSIADKRLPYVEITREAFIDERVAAGLPRPVADFLSEWLAAVAAGEFADVTGDLERIIERKPLTAAQFFRNTFATPG